MVGQQRLVVVPAQRRDIEEGLGIAGQLGQHRFQEDHQLAEQVYAQSADGLHFVLLAVLFGQGPGRLVGDPGVGAVGQGHDFAHGAGEIAGLVGFGDARCGSLEGLGQLRCGIAGYQQAVVALVDKAGAAAGDIYHFANQVRVDLLYEVFQVQVEVIHATAQFGRVVVAQVFRVQMIQVGAGLDKGAA